MRVGNLLNSFKLMPLILHELYEPDFEKYSKTYRFARRSPDFLLRIALNFLGVKYKDKNLNLNRLFKISLAFENQVEEAIMAGSTHLEISGDLVLLLKKIEIWFSDFLPYLAGLKARGITYSVHLPQFAGMFLETYLPHVRAAIISELAEIVKFFGDLDPLFVIHLGGSERFFHYLGTHGDDPVVEKELDRTFRKDFWLKRLIEKKIARFLVYDAMNTSGQFILNEVIIKNLQESLAEIGEFLPLQKLCFENLEHGPFGPVLKPLLGLAPVSVCLDIGHLTIQEWPYNKKCFENFISDFGDRLAIMHVHQVVEIGKETYGNVSRPILQDHKPLTARDGIINVKKVLKSVKTASRKNGRDIPLMVELYYHDPLPSIKYLKNAIDQLD